jgi:RNA polymerase sigma-70 factor, ECF subfamily
MDTEQYKDTVADAYQTCRPTLQRYLTSITRDPWSAEDLVQEAFLRLTIEVSEGRIPDDPGAWLHRVGHNLAMSLGRRKAVAARSHPVLEPADEPDSPEQTLVKLERQREMDAVLTELDPIHRQALTLAALGYRAPEIARSIGRTDGATRTLLCRVRAKVRAEMTGTIPAAS